MGFISKLQANRGVVFVLPLALFLGGLVSSRMFFTHKPSKLKNNIDCRLVLRPHLSDELRFQIVLNNMENKLYSNLRVSISKIDKPASLLQGWLIPQLEPGQELTLSGRAKGYPQKVKVVVYSGKNVLATLVQKMPNAGEHHRDAALIGGRDGLLVAEGSSGLDDSRNAELARLNH